MIFRTRKPPKRLVIIEDYPTARPAWRLSFLNIVVFTLVLTAVTVLMVYTGPH
jgi:hypothetical protein